MRGVIGAENSCEPGAVRALAMAMSDISEAYYAAGWLMGLEYSLWEMLHGGSRKFGMGEVTEAELAVLRTLHEQCGGWIAWRDNGLDVNDDAWESYGETFVPTREWIAMVAKERVDRAMVDALFRPKDGA